MKLFYFPGACSIGIHILLEEIGATYEAIHVDLRNGEQFQDAYLSLNPKSKVPCLVRDDGTTLTEFPAIALWLALSHPEAHLLPPGLDGQIRALEAMEFVVATMHPSFTMFYRPSRFCQSEAAQEEVRAVGLERFSGFFAVLEGQLAGREYLLGDDFSVADAAAFYVEAWAARGELALPPNCAAHLARMRARPAVQRVLAQEGLV